MEWLNLYPKMAEWRERKFPRHSIKDAAMKLGEETGEVQGAIFKYEWATEDNEIWHWEKNLRQEIGDTIMVLASICQMMNWDLDEVAHDRLVEKGVIDG